MTERDETIEVREAARQDRLDLYLRRSFPAVSRGTLQRLIEQGHIQVNNCSIKPTYRPRLGDRISIHWPQARPAENRAQDLPLQILFEDADLLVLNKPPGMVVHPAAGHDEGTLVNALLHHCRGQLSGIGGVSRPGIVHRIDKDTSGCLVVAKNDPTHLNLSAQFAARQVQKIYHALVCGSVSKSKGQIQAAIARHPSHRKKMAVTTGQGRASRTGYRVLERWTLASLVEATLHTGRTHQIRVHFQHLGHPLLGDALYGARQNQRLATEWSLEAPRQMLHASSLGFTHPSTRKAVHFEAPWPDDFQEMIERLRKGN
jgi:23S rRNA pseudouridine1911/1915/1917 synthase